MDAINEIPIGSIVVSDDTKSDYAVVRDTPGPDTVGELSMYDSIGQAYVSEKNGITNVVSVETLRLATDDERKSAGF